MPPGRHKYSTRRIQYLYLMHVWFSSRRQNELSKIQVYHLTRLPDEVFYHVFDGGIRE